MARLVASRLGFVFLDTGALYRASAVAIAHKGVDPDNAAACAGIIRGSEIRLNGERVLLDGRDVSDEIRAPHISHLASLIARHPPVRQALLEIQRAFPLKAPVVAEGRDTGSVVFPEAAVKFYLDADPRERALRRQRDLEQQGVGMSLTEVTEDIERRDQRDRTREVSPLIVPNHAVVVNTTHMTLQETVENVIATIRETLADQ